MPVRLLVPMSAPFLALMFALMLTPGPARAAQPQGPVTLHSFCPQAGCADGYAPWSGLVQGADGAYYGTTFGGGDDTPYQGHSYGAGVVYRLTRGGRFSVLHAFNAQLEGAYPEAGMTLGADGNLYGTTSAGGPAGGGCVFRISSTGSFTVLHAFASGEGFAPYAPPVEDALGNWYGTTLHGGAYGDGTVYEITHDGSFVTLHDFTGRQDGGGPQAGLALAADGNLYGSTMLGGGSYNAGTIFRITPAGALTTLHDFAYSDGSIPEKTLVPGPGGALYGTTSIGGVNGDGTVFSITLDGAFSSLYAFLGANSGTGPTSALTLMADGNFYGVRATDGATGAGTIYRITPAGGYTALYNFTGKGGNGAYPEAALLLGADGALYGTTLDGGLHGDGTVFRYLPPASD